MAQWLKQSTAATLKFGPFVDDTDGKTAETGLTIAQANIRLAKAGGDFGQSNNAAGGTHDENGYYDIPLDTTDTNTLGRLRVAILITGALPVWQDFVVVGANVFDSLIGGGANLLVMAQAVQGGTVTVSGTVVASAVQGGTVTVSGTVVVGDKTGYSLVSDYDAAKTAAAAGAKMDIVDAPSATGVGVIVSAIWDKLLTGISQAGSVGKLIKDYLDAAISTRSAPGTAQTISSNADITAIKAKTDQFVFTVANQVDANALTGGGGLDAAGVRAAIGLGAANLDAQLAALPTAAENAAEVLTEATATPIKSNVKKINDTTVTGNGSVGTPWGPA